MDIGSGLASFGNNIADAMQEYHKRHVGYDEQMKLAQALSNVGITPDGKITTLDTQLKDGPKIQPVIDKKALEMFTAKTQSEREHNLGGLEMLNRLGLGVAQRQVAEKIQNARDIPTDIGGVTVPLTPGQYASQFNEQQRIDIAKQPRGPSANLQYRKEQDAIKQQAKAQEALPEFQFQKKYQVAPKDILNQPMGYQNVDAAGKPLANPIPTTPVFREREFKSNDKGVTQKGYAADPDGDIVNFKGQRIPFADYQTLLNRQQFVYDRAKAALQRGTPPEEVVKRLEAMGFDPAGVK